MARTLSKREVEERLDEMLRRDGEPALQRLRDEAREIARLLGVPDEFQRLNALTNRNTAAYAQRATGGIAFA